MEEKVLSLPYIEIRDGVLVKYLVEEGQYEVEIPDGVEVIARNAFNCTVHSKDIKTYNYAIETIHVPASVKVIEAGAFTGMSLQNIDIHPNSPAGVFENGMLFSKDRKILKFFIDPDDYDYNVEIPKGVEVIDSEAFYDIFGINSVILPNTVKILRNRAIYRCSITEIKIPDSVIEYGRDIYGFMSFDPGNAPAFSKNCKGLFSRDGKRLIFANLDHDDCYVVPDGVEEIEPNALSDESLKHVILPESLKIIREEAFSESGLEKIVLPDGVLEIGSGAFYLCWLKSVKLPPSVRKIGDAVFRDCPKLEFVELPESLREIGDNIFGMRDKCPVVIKAPRGSYAIEYAKERGIKYDEL